MDRDDRAALESNAKDRKSTQAISHHTVRHRTGETKESARQWKSENKMKTNQKTERPNGSGGELASQRRDLAAQIEAGRGARQARKRCG